MIRPVLAEIAGSWPSAFSLAQMSAVRRSCQTMARWMAWPVRRSHTTVVSRWLVMPMAAMSFAVRPAFFSASRQVAMVEVQMSSGSCSTQPDAGKCCGNSCCADADGNVAAKHDGARGCGALIDGQNEGHGVASRDVVCGKARGLGGGGQYASSSLR